MPDIAVIRKRADFLLAAQSGFRFVKPSVIVQLRKRVPEDQKTPAAPLSDIRIGFTATKKLGNAVVRNRAKRRMRAAASLLIREFGVNGCDYVFIGREPVYKGRFNELVRDMRHALRRLADQINALDKSV